MIGGAASSMLGVMSPVAGRATEVRTQRKHIPANIDEAVRVIMLASTDATKAFRELPRQSDKRGVEVSLTNVSI